MNIQTQVFPGEHIKMSTEVLPGLQILNLFEPKRALAGFAVRGTRDRQGFRRVVYVDRKVIS